jgi:aryl-alcohol dehydrogenase-like predicted oxidoreductase
MKIGRRQFIQGSLASVGTALVGCNSNPSQKAAQTPPTHFDPGQIVPLGNTGLKVSRVGIGTGMSGSNRQSNQTRKGQEHFTALLRGSLDRGITLIDSADLYGSHTFLAEAFKDVPRKDYTLISKIWFLPRGIPEPERPDADVVVERFLKELNTDYIDILQIHCMTASDWTGRMEKQMAILENLKKKGLIRTHGVSCHSLIALDVAAEHPWIDCIHARINPYGQSMDDTPAKVIPILQKAHVNGKGIIGMKLMGEGRFRTSDEKRSHSIDFVLNLGCVDAVIVGFETLDEINDFALRVNNTPIRPAPLEPESVVAVTPSELDLQLA